MFRLSVGGRELLIISVYFSGYWTASHSSTCPTAGRLNYNELHTDCLYADTETKENAFRYFRCYLSHIS